MKYNKLDNRIFFYTIQGMFILYLHFITSTFPIFAQNSFDSTKLSKETITIVKKLEKYEVIRPKVIGCHGLHSDEYKIFHQLQNTTNDTELELLMNFPKNIVRGYVFEELVKRKSSKIFSLIINNLQDTTIVRTYLGIGSPFNYLEQKFGDFLIETSLINGVLSLIEQEQLDSLLLLPHIQLRTQDDAIARATKQKKHYQLIKGLALNGSYSAIQALAEFQKLEDIPFLKHQIGAVDINEWVIYQIIRNFPHSDFFYLLRTKVTETTINKDTNIGLYCAISCYNNAEVLQLLQTALMKGENPKYISQAISNYSSIYKPLYFALWEQHQELIIDIFDNLVREFPNKTIQLSIKTLDNPIYYNKLSSETSFEDDTSCLAKIIDFVLMQKPTLQEKVIKKGLLYATDNSFNDFFNRLHFLSKQQQVYCLTTRLQKEKDPDIYLLIVESLLKKGKKRLVNEVLQHNKALTEGWGGKKVLQLLNRHNK